jgi:hypothetical protein
MGKFGRNLGANAPLFCAQVRSSRNVRPTDSTGLSELAIGSIPIARSINPVDAVGFTGFPPLNSPIKTSILDAVGHGAHRWRFNWTRHFYWHDLSVAPSAVEGEEVINRHSQTPSNSVRVSKGAFLPRSIRLRKSTERSKVSANRYCVIRGCSRISHSRFPNSHGIRESCGFVRRDLQLRGYRIE